MPLTLIIYYDMKIDKIFKDKKVLITGNTGFKGSWLTVWMLKLNAKVYGISDIVPTEPSMFRELNLEKKIKHQFIDIRDYEAMKRAIFEIQPDFVFHLAAQPIVSLSYHDPLATLSTNIMGTAHILNALKELNHQCTAVFVTSDKCYENVEQIWGYREMDQLGGKDIYSASKGAAEVVIHSYYHSFFKDKIKNVRIASGRAGNVIGGGDWSKDRIVPDCMRAWSKGEKAIIRSPYSTRPWQHVLEPLSGYIWLAATLSEQAALNGESYNFGPKPEQNHTVLNLIDSLSKHWKFEKVEDAYEYQKMEKFKEAGLLKLNCDKALGDLAWEATLDYKQTIRMVSEWYFKFNEDPSQLFNLTNSQIKEYEELAADKGIEWSL
jgi:CDP-glucose 4,6-dehydratase